MASDRSEQGREVPPSAAGITGDFEGSANYIVPHYTEMGNKTRRGIPLNNEATRRMEKIFQRYGERIPGFGAPVEVHPVPTQIAKPTKRRTKKASVPQVASKPKEEDLPLPSYAQPVQTPPPISPTLQAKPNVVVFNTGLGKIRVVVDAILETDIGLALVFADESEVRYVPEKANELSLILPGDKEVSVMYLGINLNWYNSSQQVMLFIKSEV